MLAGVTDIISRVVEGQVQLFTTTRAGGGLLSLELTPTGLRLLDQQSIVAGSTISAPSELMFATLAGQERLVWTGGWASHLGGYALSDAGQIGAAFTFAKAPGGVVAAQTFTQMNGMAYAVLALQSAGRLEVWRLDSAGRMRATDRQDLFGADEQMVDIRGLTTASAGGQDYILSVSTAEDALRVWKLSADGTLETVSKLGASAGLGVAAPSALEVVTAGGRTWVLVAGSGSSSVSVLELAADGNLRLADHVIDTLDTRFQRAEALATAVVGDRVFVFAGGADSGVQAFMLLPDGRLITAGQVLASGAFPADNLTAIEAVVRDGQVELVLAGEASGLLRARFDPGALAPTQRGGSGNDTLTGTVGDDLLFGAAANDSLIGGAGDDVLVDGAGADTLRGGAGADVFVLSRDGAADLIRDFDPAEDRIDLSAWGRVYAVEVLPMAERRGAVVIRWGTEALTVYSADGRDFSRDVFTSSQLFGLWHMTEPAVVAGRRLTGTTGGETLTGGAGDDTFMGSDGGDLLIGGAGGDLVDYAGLTHAVTASLSSPPPGGGSSGQDRYQSIEHLSGTAYGDRLSGSAAANHLWGKAGNDLLEGFAGNDRLTGGSGNDTLIGGAGADRLAGGTGVDIASWAGSRSAIRVDLRTGSAAGGDAAGDVLISIEGLIGSEAGDRLTGDRGANSLGGGGGADLLDGQGGHDRLDGGSGDDTLIGGSGHDTLIGGSGADWAVYEGRPAVRLDLRLTVAQNTVGHGSDLLVGIEHLATGWGNDTLIGNAGANIILSGTGNDRVAGDGGADTLRASRGRDWLEGGAGADALLGEEDDDTLWGGSEDDRLWGGAGHDLLDGGTGQDALWGEDGNDTLRGGDGADTLAGGAGDDLGDGGTGDDLLLGEAGHDRLQGNDGRDMLDGGVGRDTLDGGADDDLLRGGADADLLLGGAGNDLIYGGTGNDRIDGGAGFDRLVFQTGAAMRLDLRKVTPQVTGEGQLTLIGIEQVLTGAGRDVLIGSLRAERLISGAGDDRLRGMGGRDTLSGGAGQDTLSGGAGADTLRGGAGHDRLYGGAAADLLTGASGNDRLSGGSGADRLFGGRGSDWLMGGGGNDLLNGGRGTDIAVYAGPQAVRVSLMQRGAQETGQGRDILRGIEGLQGGAGADRLIGSGGANLLDGRGGADRLSGLAGADRLFGGAGHDTLIGGSGNDRLAGGRGNDLLTGGRGADDFVFDGGQDRITDFRRAQGDDLWLDRGALPMLRGLSVATIVSRYGEDLGDSVALDFGARGTIEVQGIATLAGLRQVIELF